MKFCTSCLNRTRHHAGVQTKRSHKDKCKGNSAISIESQRYSNGKWLAGLVLKPYT